MRKVVDSTLCLEVVENVASGVGGVNSTGCGEGARHQLIDDTRSGAESGKEGDSERDVAESVGKDVQASLKNAEVLELEVSNPQMVIPEGAEVRGSRKKASREAASSLMGCKAMVLLEHGVLFLGGCHANRDMSLQRQWQRCTE